MRSVASQAIASLCGFIAAAIAPTSTLPAEPYTIHGVLPLSGWAAFVGGGEKLGIDALSELVNKEGGINGRPVRVEIQDDQSSPQVAVQLLNEIMAQHPPVILGSTITTMCNAMAPLVADGPVMYCFSPGVHPPAGSFEFSASVSTIDLSEVLLRYFRLRGWTRLALIVSSDATGQDAENGVNHALALSENKSLAMVERAHFNPGDISVAAQIESIQAAHPQALIAWTTGTALATILKAVVQGGLDVPVATTNGNMSVAQLSQYAGFTPKELYIPAAFFSPHDGLFALDPRVEKAQHEMYAVLRANHVFIDTQSTQSWDPTMIVIDALRKLGTSVSAARLRAYLAELSDYPGVSGIYDYKKVPQRGLDAEDSVVTLWQPEAKQFAWVSKPGGEPLGK
jgi:branched-chain amino acid transport system substrate-binding protein